MKQIIEKNIHSPTTALESCIFSVPFVFHKCTQKLLTSVLFHNYDFNLYEKFDPSNPYVFAPKNKWNSVHVLLKCLFSNCCFFFLCHIPLDANICSYACINKQKKTIC